MNNIAIVDRNERIKPLKKVDLKDNSALFNTTKPFEFNRTFDYKIGESKGFAKITLIGLAQFIGGCPKYKILSQKLKSMGFDVEKEFNDDFNSSGANNPETTLLGKVSEKYERFLVENKVKILKCKDGEEIIKLWIKWFNKHWPNAIEESTNILFNHKIKIEEAEEIAKYGQVLKKTEEQLKHFWNACKEYVEYVVYYQTTKGLIAERYISEFAGLYLGVDWKKSNGLGERKGIDADIGGYEVTVKSNSWYKKKHHKSPIRGIVITYEVSNGNVVYIIRSEELSKLFPRTKNGKIETIYPVKLNRTDLYS